MQPHPDQFDRVEKFLVDANQLAPEDAAALLARSRPTVRAGEGVASSPADQACLLTLANLSPRIFKAPLRLVAPTSVLNAAPAVPWPSPSLGHALTSLGVVPVADTIQADGEVPLLLGDAVGTGLRVNHVGWCAELVPPTWSARVWEPSANPLAGVVGAGLALSELFARACGIHAAAGQRPIALSLWRPDLAITHPDAAGPPLQYLPGELWMMGLGHLGQGALWSWAMLPFPEAARVSIVLQDFDRAVAGNIGPQCLMTERDIGRRKTRICDAFLRDRSFDPAIVDRPVDERTQRGTHEPALGIAAFDGQGPRWLLDETGFDAAVVMGTGGTTTDFDDIELHTLPLSATKASVIWNPGHVRRDAEQLAAENPFYRGVRERYRCGDVELAGVSVAVPFVGAIAGALAVAELVRTVAGGPQFNYHGIELRGGEAGRHRQRGGSDLLHPRLTSAFQRAVPASALSIEAGPGLHSTA